MNGFFYEAVSGGQIFFLLELECADATVAAIATFAAFTG